jgi:hypothetical protein
MPCFILHDVWVLVNNLSDLCKQVIPTVKDGNHGQQCATTRHIPTGEAQPAVYVSFDLAETKML